MSNNLIYKGIAIRDRGEMLNLTDMWRAAGSPENQRPSDWLRLPVTERRIRHLEATEKVGKSHLFRITRGRKGETLAHWKLALEYAEDLSDEFWSWAKDAVRSCMEQKAALLASLAERRVRVMEMNAANRTIDHLIKTGGRRAALDNIPEVFAKVGMRIDVSGALIQGEFDLDKGAA